MAEVQTTDQSGEMTQKFIEFVMMQAQQAAFYLGQLPNPQTGETEVHLDVAKMFIDQLTMIRAKTRGNLSNDELSVINNAISNLQMTFFEASQGKGKAADAEPAEAVEPKLEEPAKETVPQAEKTITSSPGEGDSKKKFTKSYGA
ncbi:MAG: hypothetical protein QOD99_160 [Chthoniobacter sp.]|jgi:hypothetical protein|nr:hypothetical protein [Chthoniobacter sp.]